MAQTLTKLAEYLSDGNYEMAVTLYNNKPQKLSQQNELQLARAFLANELYQKCIDHCSQFENSPDASILFDANILLIKATYLLGDKTQHLLKNLSNQVTLQNGYQPHHIQSVQQLSNVLNLQFNSKALSMTKIQIQKFGHTFINELEKEDYENSLGECMPMFIVSARWYEQFERFVGKRQGEGNNNSPGPLTHFEVVDHRYRLLCDPSPQKKYTNYVIYPAARLKVISKKSWLFLQDAFGGNELKRYNVWVMGKPKEIMTQIYLKKIEVKRADDDKVWEVQITKKQTWGGLAKKLRTIWNKNQQSVILQRSGQSFKQVPQSTFLEEVDTVGNIYTFGSLTQNKNSSISSKNKNGIDNCKNCGRTDNLRFCQCKSVKYCDQKCQKEDRDKHRKKCELEYSHLKQKAVVLDNFNLPQKAYGGRKGLVGLRNLGNTCYMNSGLQCMSNTKEITDYFMSNNFIKQINQNNPLGTKGYLACAYAELMREMWTGSEGAISPFNLKKIIGKFAGQFSGYGQQDSQEFISYLIDGLQQDLNLVKNKETFESSDEIIPDEQASKKSEQNYSRRIKSSIRDLMAGQYKSTVVCGICQRVSVCFDPFLLLTLPIPSLHEKQVFFVPMDCEGKTKKIVFTMDNRTKLMDLREQINRLCDISQANGNFIHFAGVNLQEGTINEQNFNDEQNLINLFNKFGKSLVLIAYEFAPEKADQVRFKIDFEFKGKKVSFPRFLNLSSACSQKQIMDKIEKGIVRFDKNQSPIQNLIEVPSILGKNKVLVTMKMDLSMLICTKQGKTLRLQSSQSRVDLGECLFNFTKTEILEDSNKWYCNKCKQFVRASKQMEIYKSNKILVLAFKRFSRGFKVKDFIDFPVEGLNMGPFIKSNVNKKDIIYDLYGVVNHYGTMFGGHYTAYCKNFISNSWHEFDDSRVSKIRPHEAVTDSAYVLFYRKRD